MSYQRAVWCVLFDSEGDGGSCEFWTLVNIANSDIHGDGVPLGLGATQISFITRHDLKIYSFGLLII